MTVTPDQRELLIKEARAWLAWSADRDPSDGVGHGGLADGQPGLGGDQGGVGRSGLKQHQASSTASPSEITERAKVRAFAERVLLILGESE
jgi:hypothetical protein